VKVTYRTALKMLAALLGACAFVARAQTPAYPNKPITILVPFAAGGPSDVYARKLAKHVSQRWGQPVIVENRSGATGSIASSAASRAEPDGYTLLIGSTSSEVSPYLYKQSTFKPEDLTPVSEVAAMPLYLVASPKLGINSLAGLVERMKTNPGKVSYGSAGNGSTNHLFTELFKRTAKVQALHVPYRGAAMAVAAVASGEVDFTFDTVSLSQPLVNAGRLKPLALSSATRMAATSKVPTLKESGYPLVASIWFGLFVPRNTPAAIVNAWNAEVAMAMSTPELQEQTKSLGATFTARTPAEYAAFVKADIERWRGVIVQNGITLD
jgi:tripartite-type tricarboxylate transporter receptor subunit TctC